MMSDIFAMVPAGMTAVAADNQTASAAITTAGSADSAAMLNAAAVALGPIGAVFLAAFGPAQSNNLVGTLLVGVLHAGIAAGTEASRAAAVSSDTA